jgi:hypothetical protein
LEERRKKGRLFASFPQLDVVARMDKIKGKGRGEVHGMSKVSVDLWCNAHP